MCNHYRNIPGALHTIESWADYVSHFRLDDAAEDVWPGRQGAIVRVVDGAKVAETMHWGFPWTGKGKRPGTTRKMNTTNVRNLQSPLYRNIINKAEHRCLVPFHQFAEPKPGAGREEVWFGVNEQPVSCFAGIWRQNRGEQHEGPCYAFLTCEPNPLVKPIHPKAMPVILQPEDYDRWLSGEDAAALQAPFPSQLMAVVG
tara:strand:+ start:258 stop:857 length:600 start_codon:yes stop_codon:yes gene_type:complete